MQSGVLHNADGSARFSSGRTQVLAAVYGPGNSRYSHREQPTRGVVEVVCRKSSGAPSAAERTAEAFVGRTLEEAVVVDSYPRKTLCVVLQVVHDDGGLLACLVNAACAAMIDAGVEMNFLPLASTFCAADDGPFLIDPTAAEEAREGNLVTVVCESTSSELVSVEAMGPMAPADMAKCAKAAAQIGASLHSIFRSLA